MTTFTDTTDKEYFEAIEAGHREADALRALADRIEAVGPYYCAELSIHEMEVVQAEAELSISEEFASTICQLFGLA